MKGSYLAGLLQRARGEMTALGPATMPLFAPGLVDPRIEIQDAANTTGPVPRRRPAAAAQLRRADISGSVAQPAESGDIAGIRAPSHPPPGDPARSVTADAGPSHPPPGDPAGSAAGDVELAAVPLPGTLAQHRGETRADPTVPPAPHADGIPARNALHDTSRELRPPVAEDLAAASAVPSGTVFAWLTPALAAHPRAGPRGAPARPEPAPRTGGTGPDVTISIGHIEVRAAPPTERPRTRRPFRPQVSLDDFLSQRRDQR
jgi:hypothetical protein